LGRVQGQKKKKKHRCSRRAQKRGKQPLRAESVESQEVLEDPAVLDATVSPMGRGLRRGGRRGHCCFIIHKEDKEEGGEGGIKEVWLRPSYARRGKRKKLWSHLDDRPYNLRVGEHKKVCVFGKETKKDRPKRTLGKCRSPVPFQTRGKKPTTTLPRGGGMKTLKQRNIRT